MSMFIYFFFLYQFLHVRMRSGEEIGRVFCWLKQGKGTSGKKRKGEEGKKSGEGARERVKG